LIAYAHEALVSDFAGPVTFQDARRVVHSFFILMVRFGKRHNFIEEHEIHVLEPFALIEAPFLVPTLKELASVEIGSGLQGFLAGLIRGTGRIRIAGAEAFKLGYVDPNVCIWIHCNPLRVGLQDGFRRHANLRESTLKLPKSFAKVLLGVLRTAVCPESTGQEFTPQRTLSMYEQIT
jgi:hypothetical protein